MPQTGKDYPGSYAELLAWFPDEAACLDYLEWLRWPDGFRCPRCAGPGWVAAEQRSLGVRGLRASGLGYGGDDLPPHAHAAAVVVRGGVVDDQPEARRLGAGDPAVAGAGVLPDGVGDAAPLPDGDGASRPRATAPAWSRSTRHIWAGSKAESSAGRPTPRRSSRSLSRSSTPRVSDGSDCNASTTSPRTA